MRPMKIRSKPSPRLARTMVATIFSSRRRTLGWESTPPLPFFCEKNKAEAKTSAFEKMLQKRYFWDFISKIWTREVLNEIVRCTMKSKLVWMKSSVLHLRWNQIRLLSPRVSGISSRSDFIHHWWIYSAKADLIKNSTSRNLSNFLAGAEGLEPTTHGFGDQYSTNWATPLRAEIIILDFFPFVKMF